MYALSAGRCVVFAKEPEEGQDAPEPTEEEAEQGPEPLSTVEKDVEVGGAEAWTPLFSSSSSSVKNQVNGAVAGYGAAVARLGLTVAGHGAACLFGSHRRSRCLVQVLGHFMCKHQAAG